MLGLFLVSAATLFAEVLWIRIFSAAIWYHFAFLVVSFALLGFGIAGILLRLFPGAAPWRDLQSTSTLSLVFGVSVLGGYYVTNLVPFSPFSILEDPVQLAVLFLYYIVLSLPFLCMGLIVGLILTSRHAQAGQYYAFDLLGAGSGVVLFFFLIGPLGAGPAMAVAAGLGFLAALFFPTGNRGRTVRVAVTGLGATAVLMLLPGAMPRVRIDVSKALASAAAGGPDRIVHTEWNRLSRVDLVQSPNGDLTFMIDGGASTPMSLGIEGRLGDPLSAVTHTSALFSLVEDPELVVIGSGGGRDVRNALLAGAKNVTAVEINPTIVNLTRDRYRKRMGDLFQLPQVLLVKAEGRHFIREHPGEFDAVQLTLIDTWAASASGAYSLSENYLYTVEAIEDYMAALRPGGVLSITRWGFEMPRLLSVTRGAVPGVADRLVVVEKSPMATLLVKNGNLTGDDMTSVRSFCGRTGSVLTCGPEADSTTNRVFFALIHDEDVGPLLAFAPVNLAAATDDKPFFFQQAKWKNLRLRNLDIGVPTNALLPTAAPAGEIALLAVLGASLVLALLFLVLPMSFRRKDRVGLGGAWRPLLYFSGLGVGFIVLEVASMQRFGLYLGHPSTSIIVVLFSMLVASGIGSLLTRRVVPAGPLGFVFLAGSIAGAILVHFFVSQVVFAQQELLGFPARVAVSAALVSLPAFFMGMAFPAGVMAAGRVDPNLVPWGWAMNGAMSVVGSSLAILGAMMVGFKLVVLATAAVYLLACLLAASWLRGVKGKPVSP